MKIVSFFNSCTSTQNPFLYSRLEAHPKRKQDFGATIDVLHKWKGNYDPDEDPMQQLALMISRDSVDQVKAIVDNNDGLNLTAKLTLVIHDAA